jgi:hypothetical protein
MNRSGLLALLILGSSSACSSERERPLFKLLSPQKTGVTFANTVTTSDSLNVQSYYFVYNGGGVAVGDIDNDGLSDVFLTGNMVSSRLYLNKGGMRFEDITQSAGVATTRWAGGVTMVDINSDGYLDIYVSVSGDERSPAKDRANLLFINNGNRTFTEAATQYGLADTSFATHAAFLDYDGDRDLDVFLLINSPEDFSRGAAELHPTGARSKSERSYDELYRNNGNGTFTNVSREAGILRDVGYGLGVVVADINRDGRPDLYVSNDDSPNDVLYVNNGDGTFTDKAGAWVKHASFAGMGMDVADFNNDGWPDILQTDMMPESLSYRKRMSGAMTYNGFMESRSKGFRTDYQVNTLQLSNGVTRAGDVVFSEIASLAGVAYTEWSWSALFGDYDNDGLKDIFITNGYPKAVNDYDYQSAMFREKRNVADPVGARRRGFDILDKLRGYRTSNFVFRNAGDLTFADRREAWGMTQPGFSYGAAQADLDNDGDLDMVVNNIDAVAFVYENTAPKDDAHHFLRLELRGDAPNPRGLGAEVILTAGGQKQYVYHSPYRGYMSTMEDRAHFGLGRATRVDSLEIVWPDGTYQVLTGLDVDRLLVVKKTDAMSRSPSRSPFPPQFRPQSVLGYKHEPGSLIDYGVQPLLPYMVSRQGPALAVGDVNGDSLDDVFIGGGSGRPGQFFLQQRDGRFASRPLVDAREPPPAFGGYPAGGREPVFEDWGALLFDANGDGRRDLYVASGGYHVVPGSRLLQDRLYINRPDGRFVRDTLALPPMLNATAAVRAGDFTGDGRPDLFVGGRLTPRDYPLPTRSYLLRNTGGRFTDVTEEFAPELVQPGGMVTDAAWIDFDGDQRLDLVTVGEWMPIHFYRNEGGRLRNVTQSTRLPPMRGWWYSLAAGDFDNDGRVDFVAGNLGLNYTFTTSAQSRFGMYAGDFDSNRTTDIVLTQEIGGKEYPFFSLAMLGRAMYPLRLQFATFEAFANATVQQIFGASQLKGALHYQVDTFASVFLRNNGDGTFTSKALPNLAQISPVRSIVADDVDGDGNLDVIVAGNLYDAEPNTPRADAGNGLWLRGDGKGGFTPVPALQSGFLTPLSVTGVALASTRAGKTVLVANNGDSLQTFLVKGGR